MTNQELDQLVKRANDAGYSTIAEYALALEAEIRDATRRIRAVNEKHDR